MKSTNVIGNLLDWQMYQQALCGAHGVNFTETRWGAPPSIFPCLVSSCFIGSTSPQRVISCFTYIPDAVQLLEKAGMLRPAPVADLSVFLDPTQAQPPEEGCGDPNCENCGTQDCELPEDDMQSLEPTLQSMSANLMALVHELIRVGVTTEERYLKAYNRFLALSDQTIAENNEASALLSRVRDELEHPHTPEEGAQSGPQE